MTGHTWQFDPRPLVMASVKRRTFRWALASIIAVIAALALSTANTFALIEKSQCSVQGNSNPYKVDGQPYWYAGVRTGSPLVFETLGAKGNLTTGGNPSVFDPANQHLDSYVSSMESDLAHWIQIGWAIGEFGLCPPQSETQTNGIEVYVEIHDNTSPTDCTEYLYGTAPSNTSYDARYYGIHSGRYQYQAYYQAPGSSTIQAMGWGDFSNHYTSQIAQGEAYARQNDVGEPPPLCPILGDTAGGHWNLLGNPNSNTFAGYLQLYTGSSWVDWSSPHQTTLYANKPYQVQSVSGFREIKAGGGQVSI